MKIGRYNSALTDLWQAAANDASPMHFKLLARCNQELKHITEALKNYNDAEREAEKSDKNNSEKALIHLERGQLYSKQGEYQSAINDFNQAIKIKGDKVPLPVLYLERGRCYRQIKKYDESISDLILAVEKYSKKPESDECALAYNDLGLSYYESGKWELVSYID